MATYRRSTTERWLLVVHMQSHSSPPFPPFPLPLFTWARLVKEKKKKKNQESTDTAERALPRLHESARINTTVLCFLPFHHFFFFSGKQIHARNHSKPSVLFRSHTHAHQILRKCFQSSGKCHQQRVGNTVSRLSGNLFTSPSSQPVYFLHWCISWSFI